MRRLHESGYRMTSKQEALEAEVDRRIEELGLSDDPMDEDRDLVREQIKGEDPL